MFSRARIADIPGWLRSEDVFQAFSLMNVFISRTVSMIEIE